MNLLDNIIEALIIVGIFIRLAYFMWLYRVACWQLQRII